MKYRQTTSQWAIDQMCTLFSLKEIGGIGDIEYFHRIKEIEQKSFKKEEEELERLKDFDVWKEWKNTK